MERKRNSDVLLETLDLSGKRVIDVGCGDGGLARLMARNGAAEVLGVECNANQLARARAAEPAEGVRYVEGVGQDLPAEDGGTDIVVFFNSLHHIPVAAQDAALAEAARVLKPAGVVYVCEPVAEGTHFEVVRPVDDETEVRARAYEAIKAAGRHGLTEEAERTYIHTVRHRDFESFRDRISSANEERLRIFAEREAELRALFERLATPCEGGFCFDQPMRVNLLRKRA